MAIVKQQPGKMHVDPLGQLSDAVDAVLAVKIERDLDDAPVHMGNQDAHAWLSGWSSAITYVREQLKAHGIEVPE